MISLPKALTDTLNKMTKQISELVLAVDNLAVELQETKDVLKTLRNKEIK